MADPPPLPPPVPGLPSPGLGDGEVVARAWIAALVAVTPLEALADLPLAELAEEAPPLCAAVVRALGSDDELALLPLVASGAGALTGATEPADLAGALARLRDVTFEAVLGEAVVPDGTWVARVAARTAFTVDRLLEAALVAVAPPVAPPEPPRRAEPALPDPLAALGGVPLRDDASPAERLVARAVGRHLEDGLPFAVLVLEAEGADRLLAAEGGSAALAAADRAVAETVRARDRVVREAAGRWWVVVPEAAGDEARALARRAAESVSAVEHAGGALRVAAGIACCPRDGADAEALAAAADERLLGARARGEQP